LRHSGCCTRNISGRNAPKSALSAEARAEKAERRADRAERREEQRDFEEAARADELKKARLVVNVRNVVKERTTFVVKAEIRNVGSVPARQLSLALFDGEDRLISARLPVAPLLHPDGSPQNVRLEAPLRITSFDVRASWIDLVYAVVDDSLRGECPR
jgi:hypothetical protein